MSSPFMMVFCLALAGPSFSQADVEPGPTAEVVDLAEVVEAVVGVDEDASESAKRMERAPAPPPVGVRFGEPLEDIGFRVAYQYEQIKKQSLLSGDDHISPAEARGGFVPYSRTPRSLSLKVHTFQLAYSPHPRVSLIVELPFLQKQLETLSASGIRSKSETMGIGDIRFALIVPFIRKGNESSHVHVGLDVPTGAIRRGGDLTRLPFDSQIGNGTVDLEWGWTYRGFLNHFAWGGQVIGRHPIGRNGLKYREGSHFEASLWGLFEIFDGVSASIRMDWQKQNNIRVSNPVSAVSIPGPSENPKARGGTRLAIYPGFSVLIPQLGNQRVSVEVGLPFYQNLDGPQLEQDWSVKVGWQWGF